MSTPDSSCVADVFYAMVVSPHPDDEAAGCGGALREHIVQGDAVRVVFLTSGEKGGHGLAAEQTAQVREQEAADAAAILGLDSLEFWRQPDGALRATGTLVERVRATIAQWKPDMLYVTHEGEMHPDHRGAARIVRRALSGPRAPADKPIVRTFEVWTPLQRMDAVVDISAHVEAKMAALRAYESQCRVVRFDDALLGLNRYRGELHSWPGGEYAEIFVEMLL